MIKDVPRLALLPNENILFPNPYVEDEPNPLIVTTTRVIYTGEGKKQEIDALKITYTNKGNHPRLMRIVVTLFLCGLPFFLFGVYRYATLRNAPMDVQIDPTTKKPSRAYSKAQLEELSSNKRDFIVGVIVGCFGAALGGGAYLILRRRHCVTIGGSGKVLIVPVKNEIEQDKVLSMIGAAQTSAKSMAAVKVPAKVQKQGPAQGQEPPRK
jgi:hypothetical protein